MEEIEAAYNSYMYYHLNSYYKDPIYQNAKTNFTKLLLNYNKNLPPSTFTLYTLFYIVDYSTILQYGTIECSVPGKKAYWDTWFSCMLFQLPFLLEKINFGYICLFLTSVILIISIFGGIKENYRWYILNQGIWDAIISYDFICEKPTLLGWNSANWEKENTCFYGTNIYGSFNYYLGGTIIDLIRYAFFIPLFLLSFSRFLGIYFPIFFKKIFSKTLNNLIFIAFFNALFIILISSRRIFIGNLSSIINAEKQVCMDKFCSIGNKTFCLQNDKDFFQCYNNADMAMPKWLMMMKNIPYFATPSMFFCTIFFAALLFIKICRQLKYQLKHNRTTFISTIKISAVIFFQCLTLSIILIMTVLQMYFFYFATKYEYMPIFMFYIYNQIPPWLMLFQYPAIITSFNIIRVFIDSFILLTIMNGYSSCIFKAAKFLFFCFTHPKNAIKLLKFGKSNGSLFSITKKKVSTVK